MIILGISAYYHDSAAAIIVNGELLAAAQEERFTRKKNDASFPIEAIKFCLRQSGYTIDEIDSVSFYDKPLLKFERLLETYYAFAPKGFTSFLHSMPVWLKEKLFLKSNIRKALNTLGKINWKRTKLLFPEHHLSHAASAFYVSPFKTAAILTIDGVGEWATASICYGENNNISVLKEMHFPHSLGLLYSAFTYYCGFEVNSGEYKLMGLSAYGKNDNGDVERIVGLIKSHIIDIKEDGSFLLNQNYFDYATGLRMVNHSKWQQLFGIEKRKQNTEGIDQRYANLAMGIQIITEEIIFKLAKEAKKITGAKDLCVAGGLGLNGVAFGKLEDSKLYEQIFIQPAAGDAGGAIGAAYGAYHIYFGSERVVSAEDKMNACHLGTEYSDKDIIATARKNKVSYTQYSEDELVKVVAQYISQGKVIAWFQGRMEFGPRALGSRSILADARDPEMQSKLNLAIKFRENFRPFAPIVPVEDVNEYFEHEGKSPYMMFVKRVRTQWRNKLSSITHVDGTARIQTVDQESNIKLWKLLREFRAITDCSVIINTSFNIRDEPIVNSPDDAYQCFMNTGIDYLVAGNIIFFKNTP